MTIVVKVHIINTWPTEHYIMELLLRMFRNAYSGGRVCSKAAEQKIINACKSKNIRIGIKGEIILEERKKCRHTDHPVCMHLSTTSGLVLESLGTKYETGKMGGRWHRLYRQ